MGTETRAEPREEPTVDFCDQSGAAEALWAYPTGPKIWGRDSMTDNCVVNSLCYLSVGCMDFFVVLRMSLILRGG